GAALPLARSPGLQADVSRRPPDARCRLPPGHGMGMARPPLHPRLVQGAPGRPRGSPALSRGLRAGSGRSLHRLDQRGLRRRRALPPRGLRAPGVGRGEVPPLRGADEPPIRGAGQAVRFDRSSGVLLHPTSLPGPFGIGDFGKEARRFVAFLAAAAQTFWQIMPLTPPGYGDSPYSSTSAFAGNVNLISPEALVAMGFLDEADIDHA